MCRLPLTLAGCLALALLLGTAHASPLTNGGFEQLEGGFPTDWGAFAPDFGPATQTEIGPCSDAHSGNSSLRLAVTGAAHPTEMAGVNRSYPRDEWPAGRLDVRRGGFTFWYKFVRAGRGRASLQVIAMGESDIEDTGAPRITFDLPPEHAGDGRWHEGFLKFDFTDNDKVAWVQPVLRIFDGPAEFLVDDVAYAESLGPRLAIKELAIIEDTARPGEAGTLRVVVTNGGDAPAEGVKVAVAFPEGLRTKAAERTIESLAPDAKATAEFEVAGRRDAPSEIDVTAECAGGPPASHTLEIAPGLEIVSFHASPFVMQEHGESELILRLRNTGNAIAIGLRIELRAPDALNAGPLPPIWPPREIAPATTIVRRWRLTANQQAPHLDLRAKATADCGLMVRKAASVIVGGDRPDMPSDLGAGFGGRCIEDQDGSRAEVVWNDRTRVVFPECSWHGNPYAAGVGYLQVRGQEGWRDVGIVPSVGRIAYLMSGGKRAQVTLLPDGASATGCWTAGVTPEYDEAAVLLIRRHTDEDGAEWRMEVTFSLGRGTPRVAVDSALSCDKPRRLLAFEPPMIYWGEGSFGARKTDAIFPGLEWLVGDEQSSSTLDDISPAHLRYVPHPNKITVPCITLSHDGLVVGMEWHPRQKWDGTNDRPSVVFASPNTFEDTASHLMGLFVPSVPEWVEENQREAKTPYLLEPGKTLRLRYTIFAGQGDALDGQIAWYKEHGLAEPLPMPRGDAQKEIAFSMHAYTDSLWLPDEQAWLATKNGGPFFSQKGAHAPFVDDLWLASTALRDPALKRGYRDFARQMLDRLSLPAAGYPLAFRVGGLDHAMMSLADQAQSLIGGQRPDGSWRFDADRIDTGVFKGYDFHELGPDDAAEVGTCAWNACQLLRFARITGDHQAREAGLKALAFMDRFSVPRAAQVWEVPVHTPDVLAASDAVEAYLEAHQITGEQRYLDRAVYWGKAGLPFIYMWNAPEFEFMRYASIPVFGASQLKYSWFGRPVQWNGLRYGYALQKLARCDATLDWARLARGLMVSGMYQQAGEGEDKALWPDSIGAIKGDKSAWVFAPYQITKILYTEMGLNPEPHTAAVDLAGGTVRVTSVARIVSAQADGDRVEAVLEYPAGESTHLLVCGASKPSRVSVTGQAFASAERLEASSGAGWRYDAARAMLIVRIPHTGKDTLVIEGISASPSRFLPEIAEKIAFEFDRPGDTEDWYAAHDLAPITAADGVLRVPVTGGDPYLVRGGLRVEADSVRQVAIRMKTDAGAEAQLFWATDVSPGIDEPKSLHFAVVPDGEFHEYRVPVGQHPLWQGTVTQIRLDPNQSQPGSAVEVDFVRSR